MWHMSLHVNLSNIRVVDIEVPSPEGKGKTLLLQALTLFFRLPLKSGRDLAHIV